MIKHEIKTIDDIKYCEEHGLTIYSETWDIYYEFQDGKWNVYKKETNDFLYYNAAFKISERLYYYEEQEATEKDINKLCWFGNKDRSYEFIDVLDGIEVCEIGNDKPFRPLINNLMWQHCRPLTKEEIKEFIGKAE